MRAQMTEEDVRQVLARAEEIYLEGETSTSAEIARAAEEAGLPREALERALRERFEILTEPPKVGDLVFAPSTDGRRYVARVVAETEKGVRVKFFSGGEAVLREETLRPCLFLPGERVTVNWPSWGWWKVRVVSYDAASCRVQCTDGTSDEWFGMESVRLDPPKTPKQIARAWAYTIVAASGGLLGAIVTWLLMR